MTIQGADVVPIYPKEGTGLDFEATADLIEAEVLGDRNPVVAITEFRTPTMTDADIDQAVNRAEDLIDEPITLAKILPQISLEIPTDILRQSISSRIVTDADGVPAFGSSSRSVRSCSSSIRSVITSRPHPSTRGW